MIGGELLATGAVMLVCGVVTGGGCIIVGAVGGLLGGYIGGSIGGAAGHEIVNFHLNECEVYSDNPVARALEGHGLQK
jgi:hypothetical protein